MTLKKDTYKKIVCLSMSILLVLPALIINVHSLLHQHNTIENHYHDVTTFCDDEVSMCTCSDFIFTLSNLNFVKVYSNLIVITFKSINSNSIINIYFKLFLGYKKGRSPPENFNKNIN